MVAWDCKQPGVRLGEMDSLSGLTVRCLACRRHETIEKAEALRLWGVRTRLREVARDLRCKECGSREIDIKMAAMTWSEYRAAKESDPKAESSD
jgi:DNA-directed RNA polymerase subunit RPC12/RpoP